MSTLGIVGDLRRITDKDSFIVDKGRVVGVALDGIGTRNPTALVNKNGITDGSSASVGMIGEVISSTVAPATTGLTTNTPANITSITLTPGDWDVSASYVVTGTGTTAFTFCQAGLSTTSATLPANNLTNVRNSSSFVPTGAIYAAAEVPMQRMSVSVATTVYLVANAIFTISTAGAGCVLTARRAAR